MSCSYVCSAKLRVAKKTFGQISISENIVNRMKSGYTKEARSLDELANELGVSRHSIYRYAKNRRWKRFQRTLSVRTVYRRAAAALRGSPLKKWEHVHHIDGDIHNNDPSNLHIFSGSKSHSECHASLQSVAFRLYKSGLINFCKKYGRYTSKAS